MAGVFATDLAKIWQDILVTDPKIIFGNEVAKLADRHTGDRISQPGFVGCNYKPGGLIFIAMNPGGGKEEYNPSDQQIYKALELLRDASAVDRSAAFDHVTKVHLALMPSWKIYRNFVAPILRCLNLSFTQVAYINLLKWRTLDSRGLNKLYKLSWSAHTCKQIEALAPGAVISIGSDAGKAFQKYFNGTVAFDIIPRAVQNNLRAESREAIARICTSNSLKMAIK